MTDPSDAVRRALEPFALIGLDVLKNHPGWANSVFAGEWCGYRLTYAQFEAAAAASIALALPPSEPGEGWQIVPKEPTDEMLDEGFAWAEGETIIDASRNARKIWAAMLEASPSPSDEQEHKRGETKKAEHSGPAK